MSKPREHLRHPTLALDTVDLQRPKREGEHRASKEVGRNLGVRRVTAVHTVSTNGPTVTVEWVAAWARM